MENDHFGDDPEPPPFYAHPELVAASENDDELRHRLMGLRRIDEMAANPRYRDSETVRAAQAEMRQAVFEYAAPRGLLPPEYGEADE
jgi:hypothetical protein